MSYNDILGFGDVKGKILKFDGDVENKSGKNQIPPAIAKFQLRFDGFNEEFQKIYYWHMNFAYYVGKGYKPLKVEDHSYFSESSQFGMNYRQIKGGAIRAYQENFQQVITLIRQHLLPLLKEVKEAHYYKLWFDKISKNDDVVDSELAKSSPNNDVLAKARRERNEALNHMKDKWVNEVEGGRMWQMNRAATEQGLDFALLPQLFFGINLDDPFCKRRSIAEQLDGDVYPIDVSADSKEAVARQMFRFHTWLPTAVKDTQVTFKLKISALKNIYSQVQMYIEFMRPLLREINAKTERFGKFDFYSGFENEDAEVVGLIDSSYNLVNVLGVKGLERKGYKVGDLDFSRFGLFINNKEITFGSCRGKSGFLAGMQGGKYIFYPCSSKDISNREFVQMREAWKKKSILLDPEDLRKWPVIGTRFFQRRRMENTKGPQGQQMVPFMRNTINYFGAAWNFYEIASFRASFKFDSLDLISSFIDELNVVKEDLTKYANYFEGMDEEFFEEILAKEKAEGSKNSSSDSSGFSFGELKESSKSAAAPLFGLGELFSPFMPKLKFDKSESSDKVSWQFGSEARQKELDHLGAKLACVDDVWKVYRIFKKSNGFIQY